MPGSNGASGADAFWRGGATRVARTVSAGNVLLRIKGKKGYGENRDFLDDGDIRLLIPSNQPDLR